MSSTESTSIVHLNVHAGVAGSYTPQYTEYLGRRQIVVPAVMMVEGVHSGSFGPILHSINELGKFPVSWNGIPATIDHPKKGGQYVSANDPQVMAMSVVGQVYKARVDGKKLRGELWLDEERLKQVYPEVLSLISNRQPVEVSLGLYSDVEPDQGEWNGKAYVGVAKNHRPDHLALLPGSVGACSWQDGCGIRTNEQQKGGEHVEQLVTNEFPALAGLNRMGAGAADGS